MRKKPRRWTLALSSEGYAWADPPHKQPRVQVREDAVTAADVEAAAKALHEYEPGVSLRWEDEPERHKYEQKARVALAAVFSEEVGT